MVQRELTGQGVYLGRQGDDADIQVYVDLTDWLEEYGAGYGVMLFTSPDGKTWPLYTEVDADGKKMTGEITQTETARFGNGVIEARWMAGGTMMASEKYNAYILPQAFKGEVPRHITPSWVQDLILGFESSRGLIDEAREVAREAAEALEGVDEAKEAARAAGNSAESAGISAQEAAQSAEDVKAEAQNAEAWAQGTREGAAVPSSDAAYNKHAKHWADQAAASASAAMQGTPEGYASIVSHIAGEFDPTAPYAAGDYVWHEAKLYRFKADHAAGEWLGTDAQYASLAGGVADLKTRQDETDGIIHQHITKLSGIGVRKGFVIATAGRYAINSTIAVSGYGGDQTPTIQAGDTITVAEGYLFKYAVWNCPVYGNTPLENRITMSAEIAGPATVTIPASGYFVFSVWYSDKRDIPDDVTAEAMADAAADCYILGKNRLDAAEERADALAEEIAGTAEEISGEIDAAELKGKKNRVYSEHTALFEAQKAVADDWNFPFINVSNALGLGGNHPIPGTAKIWSETGSSDLTQKNVWMSDGVHPYHGEGLVDMYGRSIANQLALISPSYHDGDGEETPSYWAGKRLLWMGTSIPAGSDPDAGSGTGATYPTMVARQLGANVTNIAKGSSMLRIGSSTGKWNGMPFNHFLRAVTRMKAEADAIAADWANIYPDVPSAPSALTASHIEIMKNISFETLLVPYLDGTKPAPDLFVIDYGTNDYANGADGERDFWIAPTAENIAAGILAEDSYMTANDYANLKLALNNDLSGITDLPGFAASLNRNCFQGACNFLITLILRYKPYARIVIVSHYN